MTVHFVTIATESKYYFPYLLKSCEKFNYNLKILGFGEKWKGFNWRNKLVLEYLNELNENDIIIFIDAYDVIFIRDSVEFEKTFLNLYKQHNFKMIVGYDNLKHSLFLNKIMVKFLFGSCNGVSLNAGTYGGFVKDIKIIIRNILTINNENEADDQVMLTKYCNENNNDVFIDTENKLFLTLDKPFHFIEDNLIFNNKNQIQYNNNFPFILHAPGSSFLDKTINKLQLDTDCQVNKEIRNKYGIINYYCYKYYYLIIILILIFFIIFYKI